MFYICICIMYYMNMYYILLGSAFENLGSVVPYADLLISIDNAHSCATHPKHPCSPVLSAGRRISVHLHTLEWAGRTRWMLAEVYTSSDFQRPISVHRPQQTVILHLMLWRRRGRGARLQCLAEAEKIRRTGARGRRSLSLCNDPADCCRLTSAIVWQGD